jgi:hypothetical protein
MKDNYNILICGNFSDTRNNKFGGEQFADAGLLRKAIIDYIDYIEYLLSVKEDGSTIVSVENRDCWLVYDRFDEYWYFIAALQIHPDLTVSDLEHAASEAQSSSKWPVHGIEVETINGYKGLRKSGWLNVTKVE